MLSKQLQQAFLLQKLCTAADYKDKKARLQSVDFHAARVRALKALEVVVGNLRALLASESVTDVLQLVKIISSFAAYPHLRGVEALSKRMFTLVFSASPTVQKAVVDSFREIYVNDKENSFYTKIKQLIKGSSLEDLLSI